MLWGGDAAVNAMKLYPTQPHTLDLTFPERFSYALLKSEEVAKLDDEGMTQFCSRFHNDALTFDQNACSSPRVIFWVGEDPDDSIERFWTELSCSTMNGPDTGSQSRRTVCLIYLISWRAHRAVTRYGDQCAFTKNIV